LFCHKDMNTISSRPLIVVNTVESSPVESFLHLSLRPVLKLLNTSFLEHFSVNLSAKNIVFKGLVLSEKKIKTIAILQQDFILKNIFLGMVLGQLDVEETLFYLSHKKEISKRIYQMVQERIVSQLDTIE
jgi:hypothetical protein